MADSLWPPAKSWLGSLASTLLPKFRIRSALKGSCSVGAWGPNHQALAPDDKRSVLILVGTGMSLLRCAIAGIALEGININDTTHAKVKIVMLLTLLRINTSFW